MTDGTTTTTRSETTPAATTAPVTVRPGDQFCAVVADEVEQWRVVAVLGTRVLAERADGSGRRSFTLHFVRHQLAPARGPMADVVL